MDTRTNEDMVCLLVGMIYIYRNKRDKTFCNEDENMI